MGKWRFILEKGSKKYECPECGKKCFVRYVDAQTGTYLPHTYGRCDRELNCAYHLNPYKDGYVFNNNNKRWFVLKPQQMRKNRVEPVFFPYKTLKQTLVGYEKNIFIQNLLNSISFPFEISDIEKIISLYYLGTVSLGYRKGAITFPFIDQGANIRTVQVKQFDGNNHSISTDFLHSIVHRNLSKKKEPTPGWLGRYLRYGKEYGFVTCLFGEHLLKKYPYNHIAIVEAPKTAIYGTLYFGFPEKLENFLWLAVYNLSSLTIDKCKVLQGREVYLFPDLSKNGCAFESWSKKAKEFSDLFPSTYFKVSDFLEKNASFLDRTKGLDLADFLADLDWKDLRQ